jgi:hypothetical protein
MDKLQNITFEKSDLPASDKPSQCQTDKREAKFTPEQGAISLY